MQIGYARVSTHDQNLDLQRDALLKAGCERVFEEKKSGKAGTSRPEFEAALAFLRREDVLVVWKLDRLGRSLVEMMRTIDALRKRLGMDASKLILTFQSRFGFDQWLQPYTDKTVAKLAKDGVRRIAVVTPGFSADCLETLEEIAIEARAAFLDAGGKAFHYIPCLNNSPEGMKALAGVALRHLQGWDTAPTSQAELQQRKARAIAQGASE